MLRFVKASASGPDGNCLEVAYDASGARAPFVVRDSKDPSGPVLRFTRAEWEAAIEGFAAGEFAVEALKEAAPGSVSADPATFLAREPVGV